MKTEISIQTAQLMVDEWIKTNGVRYFNELTNMTVLMEEVGELARIMARIYGEQSFKAGEHKNDISEELADVFFVLVCIANQTGINLSEAFLKSIDKKSKRDSHRHLNNPKLH